MAGSIKKEIKIVSLAALIILALIYSVYLNVHNASVNSDLQHQVDDLKVKRDSVSDFNIAKAHAESLTHEKRADSLQTYLTAYHQADSLNHYYNSHAKAKIPTLSPVAANRMRDSILAARGYHRTR